MPTATKAKRAFSYIRFSDSKQKKGDSKRRQLAWGTDLCRIKGWTLDESLKPDEGVSAFRGKNATTGSLSLFLGEIKAGRVRPGDVLLLESLDRLTRQDIDDGWELFRSILKAGVEIYTREPERHYFPIDLNNFGTRVEVMAYFLRAFNESQMKSIRGSEYWKARRAKVEFLKIHHVLPAWLKLSADRKQFTPIPEAVKAIKLIYKWAGEGLGLNPITERLNKEKVPLIGNNVRRDPQTFTDSWRRSYVAKLIQDRAVIGEFQPHVFKEGERVPHGQPIKGYFPVIISETEWYSVRQAVKHRGTTRGANGVGISNLFTGLIRDARDGKVMHLVYTGSSRKNNTRQLMSYGARNGEKGSDHLLAFPYDPVERIFLQTLRELTADDIVGDKTDTRPDEMAAAVGKLDDLDAKIATVQRRVLEEAGIDALVSLLEKLSNERQATAALLDKLKAEAAHQQPVEGLREVNSVAALLEKATDPEERKSLRLKARAAIKRVVSEIWVIVWDVTPTIRAAEVQIWFHTGTFREFLLTWLRRGKHRGLVENSMVGEGDVISDPRQYRTSAKLRKIHTIETKELRPLIEEEIAKACKARDAMTALKIAVNPVAVKAADLRSQGMSLMKIGQELNRQGLLTPTGKPWTQAGQISLLIRSAPAPENGTQPATVASY